MNDTELDRLLDAWEAPSPSAAMRAGVRERFPRAERRWFGRPLRWALVVVIATATLAVATEQSGGSAWDALFQPLRNMYQRMLVSIEAQQTSAMMRQVRNADPHLYVDGQLQAPPQFLHAGVVRVDIPGEGAYWVSLFHISNDHWVQAGRLHGNVMELQVGTRQARIVCNQPIGQTDWPVWIMRAP